MVTVAGATSSFSQKSIQSSVVASEIVMVIKKERSNNQWTFTHQPVAEVISSTRSSASHMLLTSFRQPLDVCNHQ